MFKLNIILVIQFVFILNIPSFAAENKNLRWGADAEGGAPYIFQDPQDPQKLIGFEVDLAQAIAQDLGMKAVFKQVAWDNLIPALNRNDIDMAMNGLEITPERAQGVLFSIPYYVYTEQLVVKKEESEIKTFPDLKGKKVGTLGGAISQRMLEDLGGVNIKVYTGQAEPYQDLALNRLDAVLMDLPIAAYYAKPNPKLRYQGDTIGEGLYGIAFRKSDVGLRDRIDLSLAHLYQTGEIKRIYEKWSIWNTTQVKLSDYMKSISGGKGEEAFAAEKKTSVFKFFPLLLKSAGVTVMVSVTSMMVAIILGLLISLVRIYGRSPFRQAAYLYVEIYRGTPLLIQLYILYYGLPNVGISFSPFVAAVLGLGMNYAAYESELYRAGIGSVPRGQLEASYSLGMNRRLAFRRIILPQALRITLPGITNDFIALFKDSSLVSVIAMV
ncbi:MAG: ABC transporter substrate-binding protein/permease, partial [Pseudomonadota bacterium]